MSQSNKDECMDSLALREAVKKTYILTYIIILLQNSKKPYKHYNDFLDDVENYETELEENRNKSTKIILKQLFIYNP